VGDRHALVGGQLRALAAGLLLVFAAAAARRVGLWIGIGAATHGSRGLAFGGPCVALWLFTGCGGGGGPGRGHARAPAGVSTRWWRERRERDAWEKAGAPRQSRQRCMSRDASITKRERALEQAAALGLSPEWQAMQRGRRLSLRRPLPPPRREAGGRCGDAASRRRRTLPASHRPVSGTADAGPDPRHPGRRRRA